jgi:hypothetical protein
MEPYQALCVALPNGDLIHSLPFRLSGMSWVQGSSSTPLLRHIFHMGRYRLSSAPRVWVLLAK